MGWGTYNARAATTLTRSSTGQLANALWSGAPGACPWDAAANHVLSIRINNLAPTSSAVGGAATATTGAG